MLQNLRSTVQRFAWLSLFFICGIGFGLEIAHFFNAPPAREGFQYLRLPDKQYPLVNQLLACNINETTPSSVFTPLQTTIANDITFLTAEHSITRAGVYIRRLEDGAWTSVNGDDTFVPASLMKIVKLIAFLNEADQRPSILDESVTIPLDLWAAEQDIAPSASAVRGKTYTVRELLQFAIINSDNVAVNALSAAIDPVVLEQTLADLEIPGYSDLDENELYTISPRLYSRFFRVLYNSTLLSPEHSELGLEWLTQSEYLDALVQGVNDPSVSVAHKFGEALLEQPDGEITAQHHDCGIVYQSKPYAVCIMTEGKDLSTLARAIAQIESDIDAFMKTQ